MSAPLVGHQSRWDNHYHHHHHHHHHRQPQLIQKLHRQQQQENNQPSYREQLQQLQLKRHHHHNQQQPIPRHITSHSQQQQEPRHLHSHSSKPRPQQDQSTIPLRLGPVARARTFAAGFTDATTGYLPSLGSHIAAGKSSKKWAHGGNASRHSSHPYPRIVVKDTTGRTLDTFTTLQEAIYRASWMRKKMGEHPKTSLEWRLPKAPVPSKPDYTRVGEGPGTARLALASSRDVSPRDGHPDRHTGHQEKQGRARDGSLAAGPNRRLEMHATATMLEVPTLEIPVDDVSFVKESLNHLPNLPAFSFLRHSLLAGRATYVHIVASILLHQKQLRSLHHLGHQGASLDDDDLTPEGDADAALSRMRRRKQQEYQFPGFCSGCRRAGFCYGCEKNPKPHIHEDVPARMGGGFRFFKRDRPRDPHPWKHPSNWQLPESEAELMKIIKEHGGLEAYEQAVSHARQEMLKMLQDDDGATGPTAQEDDVLGRETPGMKYQRLRNLGAYPPHVTIVSTEEITMDDRGLSEFDDDTHIGETIDHVTDDVDGRGTADRDVGRSVSQTAVHTKEHTRPATLTTPAYSPPYRPVRIDTGIDTATDVSEPEDTRSTRGRKPKVSIVDPKAEGDEEPATAPVRHVSRQSKVSSTSRTRSESGSRSQSSAPKSRVSTSNRVVFTDLEREQQKEEEARLRKERAKENVPFGKKRKDVGYTAPKFFTVQKRTKAATVATDPFSKDRNLNVPKGGNFQLKKSARKATKFVDFNKGDRGWTAPKKFEPKSRDKSPTVFWKPPVSKSADGQNKRRKRRDGSDSQSPRGKHRDSSADSGLDVGTGTDQTSSGPSDDKALLSEDSADKDGSQVSPDAGDDIEGDKKPKRREVVKKTRAERKVETPPESPKRLPSPPPFQRRATPPPTPPTPAKTPTVEDIPLPQLDLDLPSVPDLPDFVDPEPEKRKQKMKFTVEPPPPMQVNEVPKKRRAAPKVRIIPKNLSRPMKSRPAEAPVTSEEMQNIQDPLDFLAKYCIINPDRIPFYEIIFESTVADQTPRYNKPSKDDQSNQTNKEEASTDDTSVKNKGSSKSRKSSKKSKSDADQAEIKGDLLPATRGMYLEKPAMTIEEQHLEKLIYTLDLLQDKMTSLGSQLADLDVQRTRFVANKARSLFPEVTAPDYFPKLKKKKGKKGKKKESATPPLRRLRPDEITDDVICGRLDDKMLNEICKDPELKKTDVEMDIVKQKIAEVQRRVENLASEKLLADAFCMNHYFCRIGLEPISSTNTTDSNNNNNSNKNTGDQFRRQQSELYNRLRPQPNFEMNLEEVEEALQQINNHLLTEKEFFFLYNILNLPRREKINFRLFSIIAALSEKVTQLDPVIRKLINNFNYNALDIKMEKCKELFELLESEHMPRGGAQAASLAVELTAGGLKPEHTKHVLNKFNRESKGVIDFLDFVTYVPLFVEIHKRIISDPLRQELDL